MKVSEIKQKVAAKVAKGKEKVAKKCGGAGKRCAGAVALFAALAALFGCQNPAQRSQTAEVKIVVEQGGTATFGREFVSLAQSNETAGNDAGLTASPTTDVKPEIAVGVGGSSAGVGLSAGTTQSGKFAKIGAAADAVVSLVAPGIGGTTGATDESNTDEAKSGEKADANAAKDCPDGKCAPGVCEECCEGGECAP